MTAPDLTIAYLADHPQYIPQLAQWLHEQFGYLSTATTLDMRIERLQHNCKRHAVPSTFIALRGDALVGSAALVVSDMSIRPNLTPWLASVYVAPEAREQGIGRALVHHVAADAAAQGHPRLWLYTSDDRLRFYGAMGWQITEAVEYRGFPMFVMALDLPPAQA